MLFFDFVIECSELTLDYSVFRQQDGDNANLLSLLFFQRETKKQTACRFLFPFNSIGESRTKLCAWQWQHELQLRFCRARFFLPRQNKRLLLFFASYFKSEFQFPASHVNRSSRCFQRLSQRPAYMCRLTS